MANYATPKWLEELRQQFEDTGVQERLKHMNYIFCYGIASDPDLGIEPPDLYFLHQLERGITKDMRFVSKEEGHDICTWCLIAPIEVWKSIITGDKKFITSVVQVKAKVEVGDRASLIGKVAAWADYYVEPYGKTNPKFPDEMSPSEMEEYKKELSDFRAELGV